MAKKLTDYNLDDLYAWVESNYTIPVSEELMQYANLLDKIRGMILRKDLYGTKEAIIKYLIEFEPSLKGKISFFLIFNQTTTRIGLILKPKIISFFLIFNQTTTTVSYGRNFQKISFFLIFNQTTTYIMEKIFVY